MKRIIKISLSALLALILALLVVLLFYLPRYLSSDAELTPREADGEDIVIMSTNVRFYNPLDFFKKSWFYRADLIAEDIASVRPDIIGFQESTFIHYGYLEKIMKGYESVNAYRDDFVLSEGCPIFYRADRFEKLDGGSFWLSKTPEKMSKDWGSEHYRIAVYVLLRDRTTGKEFAVFNTHLDNKSEEARINGIKVVLDKIKELGDVPAYLFGDLNATENSETIRSTLSDFLDSTKIAPVTENTPTYHGWGNAEVAKRIDYILVSRGDANVSEYHVLDNNHDGVYSSDHSSIYIKTTLR